MKLTIKSYSINYLLFFIFILILIDYMLTFIGINQLNYISEANYLMCTMFDIPFTTGLAIRSLQGFFPIILLYSIRNKVEFFYFNRIISIILYIEIFVICLHLYWIINYILTLL